MTDKPHDDTPDHREQAERRSRTDDPTRKTGRQLDDNQDDLGRDANDPSRPGNEINKTGH